MQRCDPALVSALVSVQVSQSVLVQLLASVREKASELMKIQWLVRS
jgi:hypothetical protein